MDGQAALERQRMGGGGRRRPGRTRAADVGQSLLPARAGAGPVRPTSLNIGVLLLVVSGVALMFGSVGSWIHVNGSRGHRHVSRIPQRHRPAISQLIGVNGYVTFVGWRCPAGVRGIGPDQRRKVPGGLTFIVAAATLVFAVYDTFRIVQKISNVRCPGRSSISVGAGLICVLSAAVLALVVAVSRLASR